MRPIEAEDLDALSLASSDELQRQLVGGKMAVSKERAINAARLLYARLLAGLIPAEDTDDIETEIARFIDLGGWPWYKNDLKVIRLAIRGCGLMPGLPLTNEVTDERARARQ